MILYIREPYLTGAMKDDYWRTERDQKQRNRVAITPAGVVSLSAEGHKVLVEAGAGAGSGFLDEEYAAAGAELVAEAAAVWAAAEMVMKVKEPLSSEYGYFRPGLILFTYLHLAPEPPWLPPLRTKAYSPSAMRL